MFSPFSQSWCAHNAGTSSERGRQGERERERDMLGIAARILGSMMVSLIKKSPSLSLSLCISRYTLNQERSNLGGHLLKNFHPFYGESFLVNYGILGKIWTHMYGLKDVVDQCLCLSNILTNMYVINICM